MDGEGEGKFDECQLCRGVVREEEKEERCNNEEKGGDNKKEREGQATKRTRGRRRNWVGGGRGVLGAQGDSTRGGVQPHEGGEEEKGGE